MKGTKIFGVVFCALAVMVALAGVTVADRPVNQTPETQGIKVSTSIDCIGTVTSTSSMAWTVSSGGTGLPLGEEEVRATTGYNEDTMAVNGHTVYTKDFGVDTANRIADQNNVQSTRLITFEQVQGMMNGRMTSSEDIMIDTVGNPTSTAGAMLCPFGPSESDMFPAFCNIVQSGSKVDLTSGSVATQASSRTVAATADIPVTLAYHIAVQGIATQNGTIPAQGSAEAFLKLHVMEGRGGSLDKSEDFIYKETSSASGLLNSFDKAMQYNSGMRR